MTVDVGRLFDEYAAAFARGDRPDVQVYLDRAGPARDELGRLIDGFLRAATPPPAGEAAVRALRARLAAEPPLLVLRREQAVRVDEVVDTLLEEHGWAAAQRAKVKRYYHQLEGGLIDARRVALPVLETVARLLGARVHDFEGYRAPPAAPAGVVYARADLDAALLPSRAAARRPEQDEIDRAFLAGR